MTDKKKENLAAHQEENSDKPADVLDKKKPFIITVILLLIFLVFFFKTDVFNTGPTATGKIISPVNKTTTGKEIKIVGETNNVSAGQYVWLAFDNPEFSKCWPKTQVPGNVEFNIVIVEKSLKDDLRLSMYVLNEKLHKKWKEWQSEEDSRGVKMPSGKKHLDHVNIILK